MPLARQFLIVNYSFIQFDTDFSGQIEFPEFCNMMSAKMGTVNYEDMIRMAFMVLDKDGDGTIKSSAFKHLMIHIGMVIVKEFCGDSFSSSLVFSLPQISRK